MGGVVTTYVDGEVAAKRTCASARDGPWALAGRLAFLPGDEMGHGIMYVRCVTAHGRCLTPAEIVAIHNALAAALAAATVPGGRCEDEDDDHDDQDYYDPED